VIRLRVVIYKEKIYYQFFCKFASCNIESESIIQLCLRDVQQVVDLL